MKACLECGTETNNPKFCTRNCAATHNNRKKPKKVRKFPIKACLQCGSPVTRHSNVHCSVKCRGKSEEAISQKTLAEVQRLSGPSKSSEIRQHARKIAIQYRIGNSCYICGYSKHIDICHVRAIKDFLPTTTIGEVNDPTNLVALCRNHHWEFDHMIMDEVDRSKIINRYN